MGTLKGFTSKARKKIQKTVNDLELKEKVENISEKVRESVEEIGQQPPDFQKPEQETLAELRIDSHKLNQLLSLVGGEQSDGSPLPSDIKRVELSFDFGKELQQKGWMEVSESGESPAFLNEAQNVVNSLLAPMYQVQLLLGSPNEMAITSFYSRTGFEDNALVLYTHRKSEDLHIIRPGLSPSDVSDALLVQLLNGPHLEGLAFELELEVENFLSYLCVLDLIYTRRLQGKIQNINFPVLTFTSKDVIKRFNEIRLGEDLLWLSALVPYMFPYVGNSLQERKVNSTLDKLVDEALLTSGKKKVFQPSEFTLALAEGLLPMVSFGSFSGVDNNGSGLHLGFIIGLNVNLVVRIGMNKEKNRVQMNGMNGVQLSRLLFELGLSKKTEKVDDQK
jgi:hypothetical protein